jgi:AraC-like DNA-binding protein
MLSTGWGKTDLCIWNLTIKKIGILDLNKDQVSAANTDKLKAYIKLLYLPGGYTLTIDFKQFKTAEECLFFVNSNQYFKLEDAGKQPGLLIYYNRDFYCVQIHDAEVACDGLLFNNVFEIPMVRLTAADNQRIAGMIMNIRDEFNEQLSSREEMIRTYLKQIIILATRRWKQQHMDHGKLEPSYDMEFFRDFSRLVEIHFREKHGLADYAVLLAMAPKTLNKKLAKLNITHPNDLIKDRIILEAKRLLAYTGMSIKEIAYHLGYDDPAYFNRLFTNKCQSPPATFRRQFSASQIAE